MDTNQNPNPPPTFPFTSDETPRGPLWWVWQALLCALLVAALVMCAGV